MKKKDKTPKATSVGIDKPSDAPIENQATILPDGSVLGTAYLIQGSEQTAAPGENFPIQLIAGLTGFGPNPGHQNGYIKFRVTGTVDSDIVTAANGQLIFPLVIQDLGGGRQGVRLSAKAGNRAGSATVSVYPMFFPLVMPEFPPARFHLTVSAPTPPPPPPVAIAAQSGGGQSVEITRAFPQLLIAQVTGGSTDAGLSVIFTSSDPGIVSFSNSSPLSSQTVYTNGSGTTSPVSCYAGAKAGSVNVQATVAGAQVPASFPLTVTQPVNPIDQIIPLNPDQKGFQGEPFPQKMAAQLIAKQSGYNFSGFSITFTINNPAIASFSQDSQVAQGTALCDINGTAQITVYALASAGPSTSVTAMPTTQTDGIKAALFTLGIKQSPVLDMTVTSGTPQTALTGKQFSTDLEVTLTVAEGASLDGHVVSWIIRTIDVDKVSFASGQSKTTAQATSNSSGKASIPVYALNGTGDAEVFSACVGAPRLGVFNLTVIQSGAITSITATSGTPQTASIGKQFGTNLTATLQVSGSDSLGGNVVTFTVAAGDEGKVSFASGQSKTTAQATSNSSGQASIPVYALNGIGEAKVTALPDSAKNLTPASFDLTVQKEEPVLTPDSIAVPSDFAMIRDSFNTNPFKVTLLAKDGMTPIPNTKLTFKILDKDPNTNFFYTMHNGLPDLTTGSKILTAETEADGTVTFSVQSVYCMNLSAKKVSMAVEVTAIPDVSNFLMITTEVSLNT